MVDAALVVKEMWLSDVDVVEFRLRAAWSFLFLGDGRGRVPYRNEPHLPYT